MRSECGRDDVEVMEEDGCRVGERTTCKASLVTLEWTRRRPSRREAQSGEEARGASASSANPIAIAFSYGTHAQASGLTNDFFCYHDRSGDRHCRAANLLLLFRQVSGAFTRRVADEIAALVLFLAHRKCSDRATKLLYLKAQPRTSDWTRLI